MIRIALAVVVLILSVAVLVVAAPPKARQSPGAGTAGPGAAAPGAAAPGAAAPGAGAKPGAPPSSGPSTKPATRPIVRATTAPATAPAGMVENPQYLAWAGFKPGTAIIARGKGVKTVQEGDQTIELKTEVEIHQSLLKLTPEKAVIDTTTKARQGKDGNALPMRIRTVTIPRFVTKEEFEELGKGFDPEMLTKVTGLNITVPAGTFMAKVIEFEKREGKATVKIKAWFSYDVPGGMVKQEQESEGSGKTTIELTDVETK